MKKKFEARFAVNYDSIEMKVNKSEVMGPNSQ